MPLLERGSSRVGFVRGFHTGLALGAGCTGQSPQAESRVPHPGLPFPGKRFVPAALLRTPRRSRRPSGLTGVELGHPGGESGLPGPAWASRWPS